MSWFEIGLIIAGCLMPIVALVITLVGKKQEKKEKPTQQAPVENNSQRTIEAKSSKNEQVNSFKPSDLNKDEWKDYIKQRQANTSKPEHMPDDLKKPTLPFVANREMSINAETSKKSVAEQIQELSPELKALLIAGVLDKKDY